MQFLQIHKHWLVLIISMLNCIGVLSQNPTFFSIGKKELGNVDVYSILETQKGELYVASNQGAFYFYKGLCKSIPKIKKQKGSSLFNLIENKKGTLFCHNLNGQVFKIENHKLQLYYTLPEQFLNSTCAIFFDDNDDLILTAKGTFNISDPKNVITYDKLMVYGASKLLTGEIVLQNRIDSLCFLKKGILTYQNLSTFTNTKTKHNFRNTFKLNNQLFNYYIQGTILPINSKKQIKNTFLIDKKARYYQLDFEEVWSLGHSSGTKAIFLENDSLKIKHHFFKDQFISTIHKGKNKTYYFGTFGNGIIVVPNKKLVTQRLSKDDNQIRGFAVSPNNKVYFTETKKGILVYEKGKIRQIKDSVNGKNYDKIYYASEVNFNTNKEVPPLFYDSYRLGEEASYFSAAKDICIVDKETVLIASSSGLSKIGENPVLQGLSWANVSKSYTYSKINQRCKSVTIDKVHKQIYIATINKLLALKANDVFTEILYNGTSINANKLLFYNEAVWVATQDKGVLVYKKGKLINQFTTQKGLLSNNVTKIEIHDKRLYLLLNGCLQYIDLKNNKIVTLAEAEGFINYIDDFSFSMDTLWMLNEKARISKIAIHNIPAGNVKPILSLDSILVNNQKVITKADANFTHKQNHFSFYTTIQNIPIALNTVLHFRIKGVDSNWNTLEVNNTNSIEYKSLPIGNHVFEIYASYGTIKSDLKKYDFTIHEPFWQKGWFYTSVIVSVLTLMYFIFKRRMTIIKKKDQEKLEKQTLQTDLLDSELKALRSQMNPHFIFNSLNSIQDLILKQDTEASYDYIVLFSELVRNTLNYSNQDFICLENEIDFLEVYLKLEKLRFRDDFNYSISYKEIDELEIPSLLVQPFIENALVHGLLHKEGKKELSVEFNFDGELECIITDNGIGREASKVILERQGNIHKSFALEAIEKRLEILKKQSNTKVGYTIIDLYEGNQPTGTKVILKMPFKKRF